MLGRKCLGDFHLRQRPAAVVVTVTIGACRHSDTLDVVVMLFHPCLPDRVHAMRATCSSERRVRVTHRTLTHRSSIALERDTLQIVVRV